MTKRLALLMTICCPSAIWQERFICLWRRFSHKILIWVGFYESSLNARYKIAKSTTFSKDYHSVYHYLRPQKYFSRRMEQFMPFRVSITDSFCCHLNKIAVNKMSLLRNKSWKTAVFENHKIVHFVFLVGTIQWVGRCKNSDRLWHWKTFGNRISK